MSNYVEMVNRTPEEKEELTYTFVTRKAIVFYISAALTIVSMFLNWFPLDIDLEFVSMENVLGNVTIFTLPGALGELKESLGVLASFLPENVSNAFSAVQFVCYILAVAGIASCVLYIYAAYLRIKAQDKTVLVARIAAGLAIVSAFGFAAMISVVMSKLGVSNALGAVLGTVCKSAWLVTVIGAVISLCCAVMNMEPKEDVVFYHDGSWKISRGPKWTCSGCNRKNYALLERCYYCGKKK